METMKANKCENLFIMYSYTTVTQQQNSKDYKPKIIFHPIHPKKSSQWKVIGK